MKLLDLMGQIFHFFLRGQFHLFPWKNVYRAASSSSQPSVPISALTSSSHWLHSPLGTDADPSRLCPCGLSLRSTAFNLTRGGRSRRPGPPANTCRPRSGGVGPGTLCQGYTSSVSSWLQSCLNSSKHWHSCGSQAFCFPKTDSEAGCSPRSATPGLPVCKIHPSCPEG